MFSILFIHFFLAVLGLSCSEGFSRAVTGGGSSLVAAVGFSLRRPLLLWSTGSGRSGFSTCGMWAPKLESTDLVLTAHKLGCSVVREIFLDQGSNLCPLHWQAESLLLSLQGKTASNCLNKRRICTPTCANWGLLGLGLEESKISMIVAGRGKIKKD